MAINFDTSPYFDDYDVTKGFYRILFKPGKAVQARELTQLQTSLQKQVEHFGTHVFKDGAKVLDGSFSYNSEYYSVKLTSIFGNQSVDDFIEQLMDQEIKGETSGVKARVINYTRSSDLDPPTLYLSYTSSGDDGDTAFADAENLIVPGVMINGVEPGLPVLSTASSNASNIGAAAQIESGIFYTLGHFVYVDNQTVILSKYDNAPTGRIGLTVKESIIDATQDLSLLDNSQGTSNFAAPGADRYAIEMVLSFYGNDEVLADKFIEFERVNAGRVLGKVRTSEYSVLEDNIAKRTYDTNGDFIVDEFKLRLRESLNTGINNGVFSSTQLTDDGAVPSTDLLSLQVSEGKAFVQGFRIETTQPTFIDVEKPRTTLSFENTSTAIEVGNYVQINNVKNLPDIVAKQGNTNFEPYATINLFSATSPNPDFSPTVADFQIGVARPRSVEFGDSSTSADDILSAKIFKLHLFDIKMFTHLDMVSSLTSIPTAGSLVTGNISGATGYVHASSTADKLNLTSVVGTFINNETLTSTHTDAVLSSAVSAVAVHDFSEVLSLFSTTDSFYAETSQLAETDVLGNPTGVLKTVLEDQNKNIMLRKLPKDFIQTVEKDPARLPSVEVRREFIATTDTNGEFTLTAAANETFNAESNLDYQISVRSNGTGTAVNGDVINVDSANVTVAGAGSASITFTSPVILGNGAVVKVMATLNRQDTISKAKVANRVQLLKVMDKSQLGGSVYGTSSHHKEVSLGVADVFKIRAVYSSGTIGADAITPSLNISGVTGTFSSGEQLLGSSTGATGTLIDTTSMDYVSDNGISFEIGEIITGQTSGATATVVSYVTGSTDVTDRYLLDDGQRDNFYDISRLVLKPRKSRPAGDLLVVFDYFDHNEGDYFTVDSYSDVSYDEIPFYSASRIDPLSERPDGIFDLRSTLDFRPRVGNIATSTINGYTVVTGNSFDIESRSYSPALASASVIGTPKDNSNFECDFDYYVGRKDAVILSPAGVLEYIKGAPSDNPVAPYEVGSALRLCDISLAPYVLDVTRDTQVTVHKAKRFTMKDITSLEDRLGSIEYYTALSLLEQNAESMQIKDANGLDRFKSGFMVDDFVGHKVGDVTHPDYRCSMDMVNGILRPKFTMKSVELEEKATTAADRATAGYVKNGNIITLPFTNVELIKQRYATRIENVQPHIQANWIGDLELSPSQDIWFDSDRVPSVTVNREGNYDAILEANKNSLGTAWDAPVTQWSGVSIVQNQTEVETGRTRRNGWFTQREVERTITSSEAGQRTWSGIRTDIIATTDKKSIGDTVVGTSIIPFMRENDIFFEAHGLKPNTRVYPFFDGINVAEFCSMATGKPLPVIGTTTTKPFVSGIWSAITNLEIYYDNQRNRSVKFSVYSSDSEDGDYAFVASGTTTGTKTVTYDTLPLTFGSSVTPNSFGEKFIKVVIDSVDGEPITSKKSRSRRSFRRKWLERGNRFSGSLRDSVFRRAKNVGNFGDLQISEIILGYSGGNIDSTQYVNIHSVKNIVNADNMIDGTINRESHRTIKSEGIITFSREGNAEVVLRVVGGTAAQTPSNNVTRFIPTGTYDYSALVTDHNGSVSGVFYLPDPNVAGNPKFETGMKEFALSSSASNLRQGTHTWASASYSARGTLNTLQETIIATRNAKLIKTEVSKSAAVSRTTSSTSTFWTDPLAQSIAIDVEGGLFLSSVDLFFHTKDASLPVTVQLRTMENGIPTNTVIPLSSSTLRPSEVNTSDNGSVPTKFNFQAPVYLPKDTEIALVVLSPSRKYNVYISQMGEFDIATNEYVSEQPYLGVLFKSQNSSSWEASANEDLKFTLYRADFETGTGTVTLNNEEVEEQSLTTNALTITSVDATTSTIRVEHENHGMHDPLNNTVKIDGVKTNIYGTIQNAIATNSTSVVVDLPTNNFPVATSDAIYILRSQSPDTDDEIITADSSEFDSATNTITLSNMQRSVNGVVSAYDAGATIELYQVNGFSLDLINSTHSIFNVLMDSYDIVIPAVATSLNSFGGNGIIATNNAMMDSYQMMVPTVVLPGTSITTDLSMITGVSPSGTESGYTTVSAGIANPMVRYNNKVPTMIASDVNETNYLGDAKSLSYKLTLSTTNSYISPVIDAERLSAICYANRIDMINDKYLVDNLGNRTTIADYKSPMEADGDLGEGVYITKQVQLANPATALRVSHAALRSPSSEIQVMYKILRSDDTSSFEELGWNYFNPTTIVDTAGDQMISGGGPDTPIAAVDDGETFIDYDYTANDLPEFIGFAIKIKMNGTNSSNVPQLKDLRCIALAT